MSEFLREILTEAGPIVTVELPVAIRESPSISASDIFPVVTHQSIGLVLQLPLEYELNTIGTPTFPDSWMSSTSHVHDSPQRNDT